jgi:hypothetical protein
MTPDETDAALRIALNETRLRELNEQLVASNAAHKWADPPFADWTCECGDESCLEPVRLSVEEYDAVRAEPTRFLIAPSREHVAPGIERVVQSEERYWLVEKIGVAAEVSEELDPRSPE